MMVQVSGSNWVSYARSFQGALLGAVVVLLTGLAGCGQSGSDTKPGMNSRTTVSGSETAGTQVTRQVLDHGRNLGGEQSSLNDRLVPEQPSIAEGKPEPAPAVLIPSGSGAMPNERIVVDSRTEALKSQFPFASDTETAEDEEIPAMQTTPAMALEQYWASQQQPNK